MWKPSITGTNNTPLGKRRIGGNSSEDQEPSDSWEYNSQMKSDKTQEKTEPYTKSEYYDAKRHQLLQEQSSGGTGSLKRAKSEDDPQTGGNEERRRKRRSRWGGEESKVNIPGLPTAITANMSKEQLDTYLLHMRLEEIGRKLRTGDYVPPERERSPSPEPVYDAQGKRVNTREYRYRKKLEDERHKLIEEAVKRNPDFKPPADYKRPTKVQDKVYIPAKEFPEINFIGLLIGPRGNTLKKMESESGAKISIRGRGSVKEGKSRTDAAANANQEEDLHCLVTADAEEKVAKAVKMINKIIETSASVPEGQNELKRQQLRELAALNGTLRDDENQICTNCGATGHRKYECSETQNFTINLTCRICGGHGHTARDCMERNNPEALQQAKQRDQKLDSEYLSLMAELGESVDQKVSDVSGGRTGHYGPSGVSKPPWAQSSSSGTTPPWAAKSGPPPPPGSSSLPLPPWQQTTASASVPPPPGLSTAPPPPGLSPTTPTSSSAPWSTVKSSYPPPLPPPSTSAYAPAPPSSTYPVTSTYATTTYSQTYSSAYPSSSTSYATPPPSAASYSYSSYNTSSGYGNTYGASYAQTTGTTGYPPAPPPASSTTRWTVQPPPPPPSVPAPPLPPPPNQPPPPPPK